MHLLLMSRLAVALLVISLLVTPPCKPPKSMQAVGWQLEGRGPKQISDPESASREWSQICISSNIESFVTHHT